jgi:hypothetical protein
MLRQKTSIRGSASAGLAVAILFKSNASAGVSMLQHIQGIKNRKLGVGLEVKGRLTNEISGAINGTSILGKSWFLEAGLSYWFGDSQKIESNNGLNYSLWLNQLVIPAGLRTEARGVYSLGIGLVKHQNSNLSIAVKLGSGVLLGRNRNSGFY